MLKKIAEKIFKRFKKYIDSQRYWIHDLGEGMRLYSHQDNKEMILVNVATGRKFVLVDAVGGLVHITMADIDFESVNRLENMHNAQRLYSPYFFGVDPYLHGIAMITWTLYPDGRYFADEDGYGGECNNETNVYAFIDKAGKIIIPFRDIASNEFDLWRKKALQIKASGGSI